MEAEQQTDGSSIETSMPPAATETIQSDDDNHSQPQLQQQQNGRPPGYDPVDLSGLPDDVRKPLEDRFKYMYGQIKGNQRTLDQFRGIAKSQSEQIEQLMNGFGKVTEHLHDTTLAQTESELIKQRNAAFEAGDNKTYMEAQDKLDEIRLEKKLSSKQKTAPQKQPERPAPIDNTAFTMTSDDQRVLDAWQDEKDESGNPMRPWTHARYENDQQYLDALGEVMTVMRSPRFANKSMAEKLAEVDKRMGVAKRTMATNVMGANLTGNRKTTKVILNPNQERLALKTKFAGPGKSDAEHLDAYRKQLETVKTKGTRQ
jgi:hypothetical protein